MTMAVLGYLAPIEKRIELETFKMTGYIKQIQYVI